MITVLELGPGILGYALNGKIQKPDIERVIHDMDAKVPATDRVRLYVEIVDLAGIAPQALLRDLQLGLPRTNYVFRIEKVAIVTGSEPVRTFAGAQARLARWFETRIFGQAEKSAALEWVSLPQAA